MHRSSRTWLVLTGIALLVIVPPCANATILRILELEELTESSDLIVLGKVIAVESGGNGARTRIRTSITMTVERVFRGPFEGQTLTIHLPGGIPPGESLGQAIPGVPQFKTGEEAVVFLCLDPALFCPIVGWAQGRFEVIPGPATGREMVYDRFGTCRRYRERTSSLPSPEAAGKPEKLALEEFASVIAEIQGEEGAGKTGAAAQTTESGGVFAEGSPLPTYASTSGEYNYSGFRWRDNEIPVPYYAYTGLTPPDGIQMKAYVNTVRGAFQKWEDVPSSYMAFYYRGETASYAPHLNFTDGRNVVGWTDEDLGNALAATVYWYVLPGNYLVEFDMGLSRTIRGGFTWSTATPTPFTSYDLHSTLLHEVGHTLSLDHVNDPAEVMYYALGNGQMKRQLGEGDIEGISFIYPKAGDLTVSEVKGPASALEHESIALSATVRNEGGRATNSCRLEFYLSYKQTIGTKDELLGSVAIPGLEAGQPFEAKISARVPTVVVERDYYVCALADADGQIQEASEENNTDHYFPLKVWFDSDADGLPNWWETAMTLDPDDPTGDNGLSGDPDGEGLLNSEEYRNGTDPRLADTDGDGQNDRHEVLAGTDPTDDSSLFRVVYVVANRDETEEWVTIYWTIAPGKRYQLYYQDRPGEGWTPLGPVQSGSGDLLGMNDLEGLSRPLRLYRVGVE